jgi:hypothetical protein
MYCCCAYYSVFEEIYIVCVSGVSRIYHGRTSLYSVRALYGVEQLSNRIICPPLYMCRIAPLEQPRNLFPFRYDCELNSLFFYDSFKLILNKLQIDLPNGRIKTVCTYSRMALTFNYFWIIPHNSTGLFAQYHKQELGTYKKY